MNIAVVCLAVAFIAYVALTEYRWYHMLCWMRNQEDMNAEVGAQVFGIDPARMAANRTRIMERIAEE